jgi:hypothetical protein
MRKKELAETLARETGQTESAAADALDETIHGVIKRMKNPRHRQTPKPNALERLIEKADCAPDEKGRSAKS